VVQEICAIVDGPVSVEAMGESTDALIQSAEAAVELAANVAIKSPEQGAREGAPFIANHIIQTADVAFDDFVGSPNDDELNRKILGLE
jgi:hypothetical protein